MVTASMKPMNVREGSEVNIVLSVFRVGADGKLDLVRKYDVNATGRRTIGWGSWTSRSSPEPNITERV
jgi:hypothetical protein